LHRWTVVDHDNFDRLVGLLQHAVQGFADVRRTVEHGEDARHERILRHGGLHIGGVCDVQRSTNRGSVLQYLVERIPTNGGRCFRTAAALRSNALHCCAVAPRFENLEDFEIAAQSL
jgi:hypothetical protein